MKLQLRRMANGGRVDTMDGLAFELIRGFLFSQSDLLRKVSLNKVDDPQGWLYSLQWQPWVGGSIDDCYELVGRLQKWLVDGEEVSTENVPGGIRLDWSPGLNHQI